MKGSVLVDWTTTLNQYQTHLKAIGKSPHTIKAFRSDLLRMVGEVEIEPDKVSPRALESFLGAFRDDNSGCQISQNTINRQITALRSFFNWAVESGIVTENPARNIKTASVTQKPPVYLTEAEERQLLCCLRDNRTRKHARRDAAIIHILLDTGIRVGELVGLNNDDIDGKHLRIQRAKGGSPTVKFLPVRTRKIIKTYIQRSRNNLNKSDNCQALFLNQQGTRLQSRAVQRLVPIWIERAGITKQVTPHTLRHTFATSLLNKTGNLLLVQKALGHSNVTTTQIYAHIADSSLERAIEIRGEY